MYKFNFGYSHLIFRGGEVCHILLFHIKHLIYYLYVTITKILFWLFWKCPYLTAKNINFTIARNIYVSYTSNHSHFLSLKSCFNWNLMTYNSVLFDWYCLTFFFHIYKTFSVRNWFIPPTSSESNSSRFLCWRKNVVLESFFFCWKFHKMAFSFFFFIWHLASL